MMIIIVIGGPIHTPHNYITVYSMLIPIVYWIGSIIEHLAVIIFLLVIVN